LGFGLRAAEAGQSDEDVDLSTTGTRAIREAFVRHLDPIDVPDGTSGLSALIQRFAEKRDA
jgi:hypothetical protein